MSNIKIALVISLIVLAVFFSIRIFSPEDTWVCEKGVYVQHGHPNTPMPTTECPQK